MRWLMGALLIVAPLAGCLGAMAGTDGIPTKARTVQPSCRPATGCPSQTTQDQGPPPEHPAPRPQVDRAAVGAKGTWEVTRSPGEVEILWEVPTALAADPVDGQVGRVERSAALHVPPGLPLRWTLDLEVREDHDVGARAHELRLVDQDGRTVCAVREDLAPGTPAGRWDHDPTCSTPVVPPLQTWGTWHLVLEHRWDRPDDATVRAIVTAELPGADQMVHREGGYA